MITTGRSLSEERFPSIIFTNVLHEHSYYKRLVFDIRNYVSELFLAFDVC